MEQKEDQKISQQQNNQEEQKIQDDLIQQGGLVAAMLKKNEGNKYFAFKEYKDCLEKYEQSLQFIQQEIDNLKSKQQFTPQQQISMLQLQGVLKNNMAAAYIELMEYQKAIDLCTEIIKDFPSSIKAYFRRGVAYLQTHKIIEANEDLKKALSLNPGNPEILQVIETANKRLQNPEYLREVIMKGGMKFQLDDPYIYDPKKEVQKKTVNENDKKFQLEGARDFNLKQAKKKREQYPKSIDMLYQSIQEDSWAYIDQQIVDEYGFSKLEQDYWHLLLGIYQTMFFYQNIQKEQLENAMEENKLQEFIDSKYDQFGWFKYEDRQLQCLYFKIFKEEQLSIK